MRVSAIWLALILLLCCFPLFIGLGKNDLRGDEAGHSFSVARILETGDWLVPKSSPNEDWAFVEKPPLKFWIVAAPIRLGLLPLNDFSLRFWDALFGGCAFLYVFAIGSLMAGPICGGVAVLVCFTFSPLLFEHGLRTNDMEAAVLLSYCGGIFPLFEVGQDRRQPMAARERVCCRAVLRARLHDEVRGRPVSAGRARRRQPAVPRVSPQADPRLEALARRERPRCLALISPWFIFATLKFGQALLERDSSPAGVYEIHVAS